MGGGPGSWGGALLVGIIVVGAANDQYVIWRSSAGNGFTWEPASGTYASKDACDEAVEGRKRRIARALAFMRRIGVDDALPPAVGDRTYESRPPPTRPPADPDRGPET